MRDAGNNLVTSQTVGVRISILQGGANGSVVFMESQNVVTNANGLMTLQIGSGTLISGDMTTIDWANGPYFLKTETDPNGGTNYTIEGTQQLLSVPYALYAESSANGFSGNYNDLTNQPTIPTVPTNVSAFTNDAGYLTTTDVQEAVNIPTVVSAFQNDVPYLTSADIPAPQVLSISNDTIYLSNGGFAVLPAGFDGDYNSLTNRPTLFSGNYNDLTNQPTIPTVPTNVSAFTNDAGYLTTTDVQEAANIPTQVSAFTNDAGYITSADVPTNVSQLNNDANYITSADVPAQVNADWNATEGASQILNKPELFSGNYNDLTNQPTIPTVPTNVSAFTNDAGYLTQATVQEAANIPTNVSAFTNDAGYITASDVPAQVKSDWNATNGAAEILNKPELFSGDYNDLTNQPTIPTVPTNVSDFANDASYVNNADCNNVSFCDLLNMLTALQNTVDSLAAVVAGNNPAPCAPTSSIHNIEITTDELPYAFGDTTFLAGTATGTYVLVRTNAAGCDSTITINLTVNEPAEDFICGTSTITDADNNTYNTVRIGTQCWMKENLRTTKKPDGTTISSGIWAPGSNSVDTYGRLYSWTTVMNGATSSNATPSNVQGICPTGWHVPSDAEWTQLTDYVASQSEYLCNENSSNIAKALASTSGWTTNADTCQVGNDQTTNNATGFGAVPAGYYGGSYYSFGLSANYWSATEYPSYNAYYRNLDYNSVYVNSDNCGKSYGCSVRCVRDIAEPCAPTSSTHDIEITTDELPYAFGDTTFLAGTETGTYVLVRTNAAGCDSTITINLTINEPAEDFICGTSTITDADNNAYNTVRIGTQCWMKENLKTTKYADDTPIEQGSTTSTEVAYWYYSNNVEANKATYGLLYNWKATMRDAASTTANPSNVQGICPYGWHVPSHAEWTQLTDYVGSQSEYLCNENSSSIAKALASTSGWTTDAGTCVVGNDQTTNNATGFSALPAGYYYGSYNGFDYYAFFWSATESNSTNAYYRSLGYNYTRVDRGNDNKYNGFSVRCVRDIAEEATDPCAPTSSIHNIEITTDELPYAFGDTTFLAGTATGTYVLVRTNAAGCDSTITINLTINEPEAEFICGTSTITDADNNAYNTVRIGTQCWMKENLRTTKKPNGTTISSGIWAPGSNSVDTYGRLYSWTTVMNGATSSNANVQGICPDGWHVPSHVEWAQLIDYVASQSEYLCNENSSNIAKALASTSGWTTYSSACTVGNDQTSNNATGFGAVPAGRYDGSYANFGTSAYFWSATEGNSNYAFYRSLYCNNVGVSSYSGNKSNGYSVRCVRDIAEPCAPTSSTHNIEITTAELPYAFGDTAFLAGTATGTYTLHRTNAGGCDSTITVNLTVITFTCGTSTISDVDGNTYNTVQIGTQCWMKENLKTTKYADDTPIENGSATSYDVAYWYYPNNVEANKATYGLLYNWKATMRDAASTTANPSNVQGICPDGWHVPSHAEWTQLTDYVASQSEYLCNENSSNIAKALASTSGWTTDAGTCVVGNDQTTNNATGFGALPAGYYYGSYNGFDYYAFFWSATESNSTNAYYRSLGYNYTRVDRDNDNKYNGFSVRCVRD